MAWVQRLKKVRTGSQWQSNELIAVRHRKMDAGVPIEGNIAR